MLGFVLNCCYVVALMLAAPRMLWRAWRRGRSRQGWWQKLTGRLPARGDDPRPLVWMHAVSVGEVLQLRPLIEQFRQWHGNARLFVSTTTETGYAVARDQLSDCEIAWFPFDFTWSIRTALARVRPDLIVLVELELWPNFILQAARRRIPVMLVNGRLSERSYRGYSWIRPLVSGLLRCVAKIAVQSREYRERFLKLGADEEQVVITGSIKFDGVQMNRDNPGTHSLREWLRIPAGEQVLIAGSTQAPEESLALDVYRSLLSKHPGLRLIIVPRHPERGGDVEELIHDAGFTVVRRSARQANVRPGAGLPAVGLLDTVGELRDCWGLADVAFVGGSFGDRGGQNMLEPAAYGAAVCFGPNTRNFRQVVELLHAGDAARTVNSPDELRDFIATMLDDPCAAQEMGQRARQLVRAQQGATSRTVELMLDALGMQPRMQRDRRVA